MSPVESPESFGARLEAAFDRQMWCFGRDVRHPAGNLLTALGFRRVPTTTVRTSEYRRTVGGLTVRLWGFGAVLVSDDGPAIAWLRHERAPLVLPHAVAWSDLDGRDAVVAHGRRPHAGERETVGRLLLRALTAVRAYERALAARAGAAWRPRTAAAWPRAAAVGPAVADWRDLTVDLRRLLGATTTNQGVI